MRIDGVSSSGVDADFESFVLAVEPLLRAVLVSKHGRDRGRIATAEALSWAWENWDRVRNLESPVGYLSKVGTSRTRIRSRTPVMDRSVDPIPVDFEPGLQKALERLSKRQRSCIVLIAGLGLSFAEAATALSISKSTAQKHFERGMERIRSEMGVSILNDAELRDVDA